MSFLAQVQHEFTSLFDCYPEFILSDGKVPPGDVPIFVFHTIEHERFGKQLEYLKSNGYRTIGMDEYLQLANGKVAGTGKEVLLTIDDARSSVWRFGFPLLKQYGCKAVLFAITGWTPAKGLRPTIDDVQVGTKTLAEIERIDPLDLTVCSWEELRAMRDAGVMEVESHTHMHQKLFANSTLTGIVLSSSIRTASDAVYSPYLASSDQPAALPADAFNGYPLCPTVPLMATQSSISVSIAFAEETRGKFVDLVEKEGEAAAAKSTLAKIGRQLPAKAWRQRDQHEAIELVRRDLAASQQSLREGMQDTSLGRHLCLPFTIGSDDVVQVARELGFQTILWGVSNERRSNTPGLDTMHTVRIKNDFVWRLPGAGRRTLPGIYLNKVTRRLAGVNPY